MLEPKEFPAKGQDGKERTYILSKFPAIAGREIVTKYPMSNIPKVGDYTQSEEVMLKLMCFVAIKLDDGRELALTTKALVENHVPDWEVLAKLEWAMLEYNTSFLGQGSNSHLLESLSKKAVEKISETLTPLLARLLQAGSPPTKPLKKN
jgi:hypothetical protein